ncbi:hypothetical protein [Vibrio variabilis]|uniref:hypothetical protein n=1 Tax=Vibrio variabilis TaxID=990271 RepID=UPI0013A6E755|nr:hypothetical protein [Vibrio variabilis]
MMTLFGLTYIYDIALNLVIRTLLTEHLPSALNDALVNSYDINQLLVHSLSTIKSWIESAQLLSLFNLPLISHIEVLEISLTSANSADSAELLFKLGNEQYAMDWRVTAPISALSLVLMIVISVMSATFMYCIAQRTASERKPAQDRATSDIESPNQPSVIPGESTATDSELKPSISSSKEASSLTINLTKRTITIDEQTFAMSKTPFFYYYWYVKRSIDDLPAYINPSSSKPDIEKGRELAQIMRCFGGHARAINELEQHGLKAKTLDQNRNKIKDEMLGHFGALAKPYLFHKSRDPKTGRYQHQLDKNIFSIDTTT